MLASLWWVVPAWIQSSYGISFLHFTEQPGTVWGTTSATESLRLMSFWLSYVGIGFAGRAIPYFDDSRTLLFSVPVVIATLLVPAAALGSFVWARRWRYGPFLLGLALVAVLVMQAGFPEGTPLRHGLTFTYNHVTAVQFLRASYKAAPLLAVALACLAGAGADALWGRLGARASAAWWRAGAVLAGWRCSCWSAPGRWPPAAPRTPRSPTRRSRRRGAHAAAQLDRELPANARAMVLPGDLFSFYHWGGTVDPILPALSTRPVAERAEVPYSDLRATDPAVDDRRAGAPAAAAARAAAPAALADRGALGRHRHRRRPRPQRRARARRRRGAARRAARLRPARRAAMGRSPGLPPARPGRRSRCPRCAATTSPPRGGWSASSRAPSPSSWTARPARWRGWLPLARCPPTGPCSTPRTWTRPSCGPSCMTGATS